MFWDNWVGLADRVTNLEKENAILKGIMAIMLEMLNQDGEDIQDLRPRLRKLPLRMGIFYCP